MSEASTLRTRELGAEPDGEALDAVYLWIDERDPETRRAMRRHGVAPGHHFRDNDELRFSLRSLELHAPWVGRIHLVVGVSPPAWIRTTHPRLRIVTHETIFPDPSVLPSFNSNAIETNLHRIPDLSEEFLYLNDDLFLGAALLPGEFRTVNGGQRFFLDGSRLHADPAAGSTHDRAYASTAALVKSDRDLGGELRLPAHCPQLYKRSRLVRLEERFREYYDRTRRNRRRAPDDFVFRVAYMLDLIDASEGDHHEMTEVQWCRHGYRMIRLGANPMRTFRDLRVLARMDPSFFCINDEMRGPGRPLSAWQMRRFLQRRFPVPSSFECAS